jgi:hypothetical protein
MIKKLIISKNGVKQVREIKSSNLKYYSYNKSLRSWKKKSDIKIKRIKFELQRKQKEKIISKKVKKVVTKGCNFNYKNYYKGVNHDGYVREMNTHIIISEDNELEDIEMIHEEFKNFLFDAYENLPCPLRFMYASIHYTITISSNNFIDSHESSNATKIQTNITDTINELYGILYKLYNLILKSSESKIVNIVIHKFQYVNYEFLHILKERNSSF